MRINGVGRFLVVSVLSVSLCPAVVAVSDTPETVQTYEMEPKTGVQEQKAEGTRRRLPSILSDQDRDSENRARAFSRLKLGSMLRIYTLSAGEVVGRLKRKSDASITLIGGTQEVYIAAATIDALWVRRTARGTGAIVGGLVGLAIGIGVGANAKTVCEKNIGYSPGGDCARSKTVLGFAFAIGGAILGASIGQTIPSWHLSYNSSTYDHWSVWWPDHNRGGGTIGPARGLRLAISLPF